MKVLLGVIGNGRGELLEQTIDSLHEMVDYEFYAKVMIDDTGRKDYAEDLLGRYGDEFYIISHDQNKGLSGSVRSLWQAAQTMDVDYVFHLEEDFTFNEKIDLNIMMRLISHNKTVAQVALKRQPCNVEEIAAGGFMELAPLAYKTYSQSRTHTPISEDIWFVSHRNFFTLNPSLYPRWVVDLGWEQGWGEKEFAERLFAVDSSVRCNYLGKKDDPPKVTHTGGYRAEGWTL